MPKYFGERRGELYYQRDGKWHHCRDNGRSFDTLEDARRDFDKVYPKNYIGDTLLGGLFVFLVIILFLKFAVGIFMV
jgi:hypothetical protein